MYCTSKAVLETPSPDTMTRGQLLHASLCRSDHSTRRLADQRGVYHFEQVATWCLDHGKLRPGSLASCSTQRWHTGRKVLASPTGPSEPLLSPPLLLLPPPPPHISWCRRQDRTHLHMPECDQPDCKTRWTLRIEIYPGRLRRRNMYGDYLSLEEGRGNIVILNLLVAFTLKGRVVVSSRVGSCYSAILSQWGLVSVQQSPRIDTQLSDRHLRQHQGLDAQHYCKWQSQVSSSRLYHIRLGRYHSCSASCLGCIFLKHSLDKSQTVVTIKKDKYRPPFLPKSRFR